MVRPDRDLAVRLTDASNAKYHMGQVASDYEGVEVGELNRPGVDGDSGYWVPTRAGSGWWSA
jgi:hypothetical protein